MAHKHSIYDTDKHYVIDPITRRVSTECKKVMLMQNDHNSERITFEVPRLIDGHDMASVHRVEIHYINTDKKNKSEDVYEVNDIQISPVSDDMVIFSWLVRQTATMYNGSLSFIIRFACLDPDKTIVYQWFTDIYSGITIGKGIYNSEVVTGDDDPDILACWKKEIMDMIDGYVNDTRENAEKAAASAEAAKISETKAAGSAALAADSAANAKTSELNAKDSEEKAKASEIIASTKADESSNSALLSKSYAHGGSGIRVGEESDNSKVYKESAEAIAKEAHTKLQEVGQAVTEFEKKLEETEFSFDTETGNLQYESPNYRFVVNPITGMLEWEVV